MASYKDLTPEQKARRTEITRKSFDKLSPEQKKVKSRKDYERQRLNTKDVQRMNDYAKTRYQRLKETNPFYSWVATTKGRAKKKNIPFDLTEDYIESIWTDTCPVLGFPLNNHTGMALDDSPSIDRIIPEKGYVRGNVRIISKRANTLISNGTLQEHCAVVKFLQEYEKSFAE